VNAWIEQGNTYNVKPFIVLEQVVYAVNGQQAAKIGHCPFFKFDCPFKTDRQGKPIVSDNETKTFLRHTYTSKMPFITTVFYHFFPFP
jgi:hypothetical protein